jgi:hypothetical protein
LSKKVSGRELSDRAEPVGDGGTTVVSITGGEEEVMMM